MEILFKFHLISLRSSALHKLLRYFKSALAALFIAWYIPSLPVHEDETACQKHVATVEAVCALSFAFCEVLFCFFTIFYYHL